MNSGTQGRRLHAAGWKLAAGLAAACVAMAALADSDRRGEQVYKETCIACHETGKDAVQQKP